MDNFFLEITLILGVLVAIGWTGAENVLVYGYLFVIDFTTRNICLTYEWKQLALIPVLEHAYF